VTEPNNSIPDTPLNTTASIGWVVLIAATLYVCYFSHLGAIGFVGPDEPRYAWIARDMMETGDWVTPRLYGKPWFEKPPLLYWGAALSFKYFGVSEVAARLPSAVSALLATLALAWLALRLYGAETARWLLLLLPTTVGMIGFSHAAATDMPFAGMLTIAMVCAAVVIGLTRNENTPILPRTPWLALFLFGLFLGLATLAKGPAAIVLTGGAVFFWALFTKHWRDAFRLLHPIGIASFCLTALPWYILCARRNPDFLRVFLVEHNFNRYLTPEFHHIQPFWFYLPILLIAFLPWTGAIVWSAVVGIIRIATSRKLAFHTLFLLSWPLFVLLFFSFSQSKLPGYVLPAVPALALLLAQSYTSSASEQRKSFGVSLVAFALICFGISALTARLFPHASLQTHRAKLAMSFLFGMIALANATLAIGYLCFERRWKRHLTASLCVLPILFALLLTDELISGFAPLSAKDLAIQLRVQHLPPDLTFIYYGMSTSFRYGLSFYLHKDVAEWDQNPSKEAYVLSGSRDCRSLAKEGFQCTEMPLGRPVNGWFVSHVMPKNLADGLPPGGQPQQKE
jgi:4-amino-4-deoxy-L-arabinose transferase-like glycosyltransferase